MGVRNLRAICPKCGGKIHTQPKGLGHLSWANSGMLVQTGNECQHCGVALSGKVGMDNKAILAEDANKSWWQRQKEAVGLGTGMSDDTTMRLNALQKEWKQSGKPKPGEIRLMDGAEMRWGADGWEPVDQAADSASSSAETDHAQGQDRDELAAMVTKLDDLRAAGILSDDEYEAKRATIERRDDERRERRDELIAMVDKLDDLRDAGVLSDAEYEAKRAEIDRLDAEG